MRRDDRHFTRGVHRYDRRRCDYCDRMIGINVRAQHYRAKHYPKAGEHGPDCVRWDGQLWTCGEHCRAHERRAGATE